MTPDPKMSGESFDRPERAEAERIVREEWRPYNLGEIVSLHMEADLESALIKAREEGRAECMEKFRALERRNRELEAEVAMLRGDGAELAKCQCKAISE